MSISYASALLPSTYSSNSTSIPDGGLQLPHYNRPYLQAQIYQPTMNLVHILHMTFLIHLRCSTYRSSHGPWQECTRRNTIGVLSHRPPLFRNYGGLLDLPRKEAFAETADLIYTRPVQLPDVFAVPYINVLQEMQDRLARTDVPPHQRTQAEPKHQGPSVLDMTPLRCNMWHHSNLLHSTVRLLDTLVIPRKQENSSSVFESTQKAKLIGLLENGIL